MLREGAREGEWHFIAVSKVCVVCLGTQQSLVVSCLLVLCGVGARVCGVTKRERAAGGGWWGVVGWAAGGYGWALSGVCFINQKGKKRLSSLSHRVKSFDANDYRRRRGSAEGP